MAKALGTTPPAAANEQQAAAWVRGMFGRVAGRYDLLNHLLSFNIDKIWRKAVVKRTGAMLARRNAAVLDLCCGTGDLLLALQARTQQTVLGSDFCHPMLLEARRKVAARGARSPLFEADALELPLATGSLDLVTVAFGFRNFASYQTGLTELLRVLKPGGALAILEFSTPPNPLVRAGYGFYSRHVLPRVGAAISGDREAYSYLPESVRKFPGAEELADDMLRTGFQTVQLYRLTFGIVALHIGVK
ncbi:MAG: bifunctional demethylmenaquinone methyltransferase/2-methoxy-6-polyprenyl-1,4-benzoquinol methylase UbiE [Acidobacteria bacterium]|nr:bifunctional demethylmenaquinone methyltransferase/2-methoxy-6-polyprenyl-1,4-benzoquinol methylase UbiE [Acidobacteriota bacterium]